MSIQLQSTSTVLSVSVKETEPLPAIKNEPLESEIGIDDIPNSLDEEIIADVKEIDIVSHELSEDLIKSETMSENTFGNNYSGSVETLVFVKTENISLIKTENINQSEYLHKTQDTRDGNVNRGTSQRMIEVQDKEGSNENFNALKSDKQFVNFFKDLSDINRKVKCLNKKDFSECYKTIETTSCEKNKKKGKVIEVPVIPIEPHRYTSLAKESIPEQNKRRYCCEKCTFISENHSHFKRHKLSHKTKAKVNGRYLKYRCDKYKYKTCRSTHFKRHKLIHLKPEQIPYFYCYHCPYKCKSKSYLKIHIFNHFKKEEVPFYCYICDFTTLKRNLIIKHFKKHPKHHSKCDETDYKNQFEYCCDKCKYKSCWLTNFKTHKLMHLNPEQIPYIYCYHCSYKCKLKSTFKTHIFNHFKKEEVPFHCYICDFTTLKRILIIKHFKKHPEHHSKCDETDYKNHLETYTKKRIRYSCEKCMYTSGQSSDFKRHQLTHKSKAEIDDRLLKYRCDKCKYKTCWFNNLRAHKLTHLKPEEIPYFYCYHCSFKSKQKGGLKTHIFNHFKRKEIPFHCYICDFLTLKRDLIIEHFKKHPKHHSKCDETDYKNQLKTYTKKQMRYCCKKCVYTSGTSSAFKRHQLTHKTKAEIDNQLLKYRCDKCKYKTYLCGNLKAHKLTHLKPEEIPYFYCDHCFFKSKQKNGLKAHIFRHFKNEDVQFHCYICDFATLKRNLIIEHFKKHRKHHSKYDETDYKNHLKTYTMRYSCEKCMYTCGQSSDFKRHQLTHKTKSEIDDRLLKYRCDKCKYKTCWSTSFKNHKLIHLKPEEIPYFYCYHCSFKSKQKGGLKNHIFRHFKIEDVPFHCYICDFTTLKRNLIFKHLKKHPKHHSKCDETEYRNQIKIPYFYCYHCSFRSKQKSSLKRHIFNHFKKQEVPFHCYICDFTTPKRNLIIEHLKKHPKHLSKCDETEYRN